MIENIDALFLLFVVVTFAPGLAFLLSRMK